MGRLDGKVALITGATGGIGTASARRFAAEGARVWLVDRDPEPLAALAIELGGGWSAGDVAEEDTHRAAVTGCVERFGGLDILFANAGTEGRVAPIVDQRVEDFDRVLAVNVRSVFLGIRAAAGPMGARGGGSIVVTSSIAGMVGSPGVAPYVTSKHALSGLVRTAAIELAAAKIRVNSVHPGPIDNRMMRSLEGQLGDAAAVQAAFTAKVPLGRYGTNEEIASVALFLASDDSGYVTGAALVADGGFVAG